MQRFLLGGLLGFLALNAFAGGYYAMAGAPQVPTAWLVGSPFGTYFVPGLILFVVVGGSMLVAAVGVIGRRAFARRAAAAAGFLLFGWLAVQLGIIGYVSWMQPATGAAGLVVLALVWTWPARRHA